MRSVIPGRGVNCLAGAEIAEFDRRRERLDADRKQRKAHEPRTASLDAGGRLEVAGPDAQLLALARQRLEERQADDVVEMAMGEEDVGVAPALLVDQRLAEVADAGAGVENQHLVAAADLHAGRVAAIAGGPRPGTRDAAAHAPEAYQHRRRHDGFNLPPPPEKSNVFRALLVPPVGRRAYLVCSAKTPFQSSGGGFSRNRRTRSRYSSNRPFRPKSSAAPRLVSMMAITESHSRLR